MSARQSALFSKRSREICCRPSRRGSISAAASAVRPRNSGVHENTVRLRLNKVQTLTGLDMTNANDQLSVQTALLVLRLQGHPAVDERAPAPTSQRKEGTT
ncbi:helix-turn-helix domain-containing protein [Kribbia dieselivorans]|uniref:helix-turn-helix domain-containing protein n=1 Tax=Kribbia dieselivorans TaxID=331526 RepID=UPI0009FAD32E